MTFLDRLATGEVLIGDGALGTMLSAAGMLPGECPEAWNLTHPDAVEAVFDAYVAAGSDLIETNSFGGTAFKLGHYCLEEQVKSINIAAAALSHAVAGGRAVVAASVGPTGCIPEDEGGDVSEQALEDAFAEQVAALAEGGAGAICVETMSSVIEAAAAVRAAKRTGLPVLCTFTFNVGKRGPRTMMGASPADAGASALDAGADVIGANCGTGGADMVAVCAALRAAFPAAYLLVQPNAGLPVLENGRTVFTETPEVIASFVPALLAAGANIIGGCCGTTPAHIAAIRAAVTKP